jgi:hypothetical protein
MTSRYGQRCARLGAAATRVGGQRGRCGVADACAMHGARRWDRDGSAVQGSHVARTSGQRLASACGPSGAAARTTRNAGAVRVLWSA